MRKFLLLLSLVGYLSSIYSQEDTTDTEFETHIVQNNTKHKGGVGSFGRSLSHLTSFVSLNGYATNEFLSYQDGKNTFNSHYFNLLASAEVTDKIFAEIQMEYEYGGTSLEARYAQVDYKFNDRFIIRSGKFLVPAGEFNEYLYPEYLSKTTNRAFVNENIIPVSWGEVGVQLRGNFISPEDSAFINPFYSIYLVNGLRGQNGGDLRPMRGNVLDTTGSVAYGGNLGTQIGNHFNIQFNYYYGDYDPTATLDLIIAGSSVSYDDDKFSFYGSFHTAQQEYLTDINNPDSEDVLNKFGFYGQVAYKFKNFEPVLRYDQIRLDGAQELNKDRFTFGMNYYFYKHCVVKVNYELIKNQGIDLKDNLFSLQLALGF